MNTSTTIKSTLITALTLFTIQAFGQLNGTYYINQNASPSSTNFVSFNAAIESLESNGISGSVTINVVQGSGPYTEQVKVPRFTGASAYKVIINGHNEELNYHNTTANGHYVFCFDSAKNIVIKNLILRSKSYSKTRSIIEIKHGSEDITIENNNIYSPKILDDVDKFYSVGISISDSLYMNNFNRDSLSDFFDNPSYLKPNPTRCKNIIIKDNYIQNSMFGIVAAYDTSFPVISNIIQGNTIVDFIYTAIADFGSNDIIRGNDISRPNLKDTKFSWPITGIFVLGGYDGGQIKVSNNYLHDIDGNTGKHGIWVRRCIYSSAVINWFIMKDGYEEGSVCIDSNKIELNQLNYCNIITVRSNEDTKISHNDISYTSSITNTGWIMGITSSGANGKKTITGNKLTIAYDEKRITGTGLPISPIILQDVGDSCLIANNIISYDIPNIAEEYLRSTNLSHWMEFNRYAAIEAISCSGNVNSTISIAHNTININSCTTDTLSPEVFTIRGGNYLIENNLISMKGLGTPGRLIKDFGAHSWTASHNAIHYEVDLDFISNINNNTTTTLDDFNTISNGINIVANPKFVDISNCDFRPTNTEILDGGLSLGLVTTDFYGNTRSSTPDIGAIEVQIDLEAEICEQDYDIFPNPSSGIFNVKNIYCEDEIKNIQVYNRIGRLIFKTSKSNFDLKNYSPGIYYVKIASEHKTGTKKVILESYGK